MARVATTLADQPEREHRLLVENAQLQRDLADERTTIAKLSETVEQERSVAEQLSAELASARATLETLATEVEHLRTAEHAWKEHGDAARPGPRHAPGSACDPRNRDTKRCAASATTR